MQSENGTVAPPSADSMTRALEEYLAAAEAGTAPPREEFLARYPALAGDLDACLSALRFIGRAAEGPRSVAAEVAGAEAAEQVTGTLGDFRIVREVGRGGMGVVYEAEQVSLGRRVALKVLPFAATMDPRRLQRFHNEARAAASLDHPHIVHVHAVGCERAVHFYAMQFIDGQTLAALIAELRRAGGQPVSSHEQPTTPHVPGLAPAVDTAPQAAASTERAPRDRAYFRRVAEWGIQAAEALDHAHQLGIVHRDVKPANLLIDGRGQLWVTDFGLAHMQSDAHLTMTGDLVGTLRYMSPEQALAQRVVLDHRTDVYSLGATLYELLTLEPAFGGQDRQELLRQIAFEEPRPPRRLNKAIPADVETIVLKAMEKRPQDRYATAQNLADDLRRWLLDQPIRARRPTLVQRMARWGRRHRPVVVAGILSLLLALIALGLSNFLIWRAKQETADALTKSELHKQEVNNLVAVVSEQRERSDRKVQIVFQAMNRLLVEAEEKGPVPSALSDQAIQFYEDILPLDSNRPPMQLEEAWAYIRLGNLYAMRDQFDKAKMNYVQAKNLIWRAQMILPEGVTSDGRMPVSQAPLGVEKAFRRALAHWRATRGGWEKVAVLSPLLPLLVRRAGPHFRQMPGTWKQWDFPGSDRVYREEVRWQERVLADFPILEHRDRLVTLHTGYGEHLQVTGHLPEARAAYLRALNCAEKWESSPTASSEYGLANLAFSLMRLADRFRHLAAPEEAEQAYRSAWKAGAKLAGDQPDKGSLWILLQAFEQYRPYLEKAGHLEEAREAFRRALLLREKSPIFRIHASTRAADGLVQLGSVLVALKAPEDAERAFRAGLHMYQQTLDEDLNKLPSCLVFRRFQADQAARFAQFFRACAISRSSASFAELGSIVALSIARRNTCIIWRNDHSLSHSPIRARNSAASADS